MYPAPFLLKYNKDFPTIGFFGLFDFSFSDLYRQSGDYEKSLAVTLANRLVAIANALL